MSLNLLLGYTGQLSLGHVAFFGIGAYASALTTLGFDVEFLGGFRVVHEPWPAVVGFFVGIVIAGMSGYLIGQLSFKVRGAYFVIVTISFAEVTRLVALNWVELTQGPLALTNIPPFTLGFPGLGTYTLWGKAANYYLVARRRAGRLPRHQPAGRLPHRPRHDRAEGKRAARKLGRHRRDALSRAGGGRFRGDRRRRRKPVRALSQDHRSRHFPVHLHRHDGDHGDHRAARGRWPGRSSAGSFSASCR